MLSSHGYLRLTYPEKLVYSLALILENLSYVYGMSYWEKLAVVWPGTFIGS